MELNSNELKALIHLADGKQHNDYPDTLSFAQYCVALKSLYSKGLVYAAFIEGGEAECAQIKIEGQAALDDLRDRQGGISIDEEEDDEDEDVYKVLEWLSDGKEHFDYLDIPFFDEICEELETYRLINSGLSKDDGLKITRKGLKYFLELIK
ncbi:MAG: hypothetical protein J5663_02945, partial [Bacteroidaceae bacterium]|nr:hypothetical protein [Bacteroidaceae bacterium]